MADAWYFISGIIVGGLSVFLVTNTILRSPEEESNKSPEKPALEDE